MGIKKALKYAYKHPKKARKKVLKERRKIIKYICYDGPMVEGMSPLGTLSLKK